MEKLIDKRDGKAILYVLKNLESSEKVPKKLQRKRRYEERLINCCVLTHLDKFANAISK